MPIIGITGGLATGKSTAAALFRNHGAAVFSADEAARGVTSPGSAVLRKILDTFGPAFLLPDGQLDRAALGEHVFAHPDARRALESITHPPILQVLREQIDSAKAALPDDAVIAVETPLLFEAGMESWFDRIVVVAAAEATQIARLCRRNGFTPEEARRRIAAQMPLADKIARANDVLWNDGPPEALAEQVEALWRSIAQASG